MKGMERGNVDLGDGELHDADGLERQAILHDDFENGGGVEDEPGEPELVAGDIDDVIERDRGGRAGGLLAMRRKRKRNVARQNQIQRFVLVFEIEQRDLVQLDHSTRESLRPFAQAADRLIVHQQSVLLDRPQHLLAEILAAHVLRSLLRRNASENELRALSAVAVDRHAADFALVDRVDDAREKRLLADRAIRRERRRVERLLLEVVRFLRVAACDGRVLKRLPRRSLERTIGQNMNDTRIFASVLMPSRYSAYQSSLYLLGSIASRRSEICATPRCCFFRKSWPSVLTETRRIGLTLGRAPGYWSENMLLWPSQSG